MILEKVEGSYTTAFNVTWTSFLPKLPRYAVTF